MTTLFSQFIAGHRNGVADVDIAERLAELVEACARSGKSGRLTLTLTVAPQGDMVVVADDVKTTAPKESHGKAYWIGADGTLTTRNPLQPELPLTTTKD